MSMEVFYEDEWLSSIINYPVYHLQDNTLAEDVSSLGGGIFCDAKCSVDDISATRVLSQAGFFVADVNLYFEGSPVVENKSEWTTRVANSDDALAVAAIAEKCFSCTRFHLDPYVGEEKANKIKREWTQNYFKGSRGDLMIVAEGRQGVVGFLQLIRKDNGLWIIDLIGVDINVHGQGVGSAMISAMGSLCEGIKCIGVGTQVANTSSIAFYQKQGFVQKKAQYVFHYHGGNS